MCTKVSVGQWASGPVGLFLRNTFVLSKGLQQVTGSSCAGHALTILVGAIHDVIRVKSVLPTTAWNLQSTLHIGLVFPVTMLKGIHM